MYLLRVYVASHCSGCGEAVRLANMISERFSTLTVEIIDLDQTDSVRPDHVFAVPTYVLDGQILALGNPKEAQLEDWITRATERGGASN